ncbi:unnamed protein product [Ilex paraguariensis]|uniref:Uncharacterized protein n=1 Tax=Ilex paraguariensis TaxID=185542 RepID=A0ABC8UX69_9AQUA
MEGGTKSMSSVHNLGEDDPRVAPRNLGGATTSHSDTSGNTITKPRETPNLAGDGGARRGFGLDVLATHDAGQCRGVDRPEVDGGAICVGGINSREVDTINVGDTINEREDGAHGRWHPTRDASGVGETGRKADEHKLGSAGGQGDFGGGLGAMGDVSGGLGATFNIGGGLGKWA